MGGITHQRAALRNIAPGRQPLQRKGEARTGQSQGAQHPRAVFQEARFKRGRRSVEQLAGLAFAQRPDAGNAAVGERQQRQGAARNEALPGRILM